MFQLHYFPWALPNRVSGFWRKHIVLVVHVRVFVPRSTCLELWHLNSMGRGCVCKCLVLIGWVFCSLLLFPTLGPNQVSESQPSMVAVGLAEDSSAWGQSQKNGEELEGNTEREELLGSWVCLRNWVPKGFRYFVWEELRYASSSWMKGRSSMIEIEDREKEKCPTWIPAEYDHCESLKERTVSV